MSRCRKRYNCKKTDTFTAQIIECEDYYDFISAFVRTVLDLFMIFLPLVAIIMLWAFMYVTGIYIPAFIRVIVAFVTAIVACWIDDCRM